jgi:subtilisin family serine protease
MSCTLRRIVGAAAAVSLVVVVLVLACGRGDGSGPSDPTSISPPPAVGTTDHYLVTFAPGREDDAIAIIRRYATAADPKAFRPQAPRTIAVPAKAYDGLVVLSRLRVAIVKPDSPAAAAGLAAEAGTPGSPILAVEQERVSRLLRQGQPQPASPPAWGLSATGVPDCAFTGKGVKIAILDTGLVSGHPDLPESRVEARMDFALDSVDGGPDEEPCIAHDRDGHGTHVAGVAAGAAAPASGPRFGAAPDAVLVVGRVFDAAGFAKDRWVLDAIDWAVELGCQVISISLGEPLPPSAAYESAAIAAMQSGTLIVAAAGNSGRATDGTQYVWRPANCRGILAVGAAWQESVTGAILVAPWSAIGTSPVSGGAIAVVAPGVEMRTADRLHTDPSGVPVQYAEVNGTSMAAPMVAGIAALWIESGTTRVNDLAQAIKRHAVPVVGPAEQTGNGLVRAP